MDVLTVIVYVGQNSGSPVFSTVSAVTVYKLVTAMPRVLQPQQNAYHGGRG